jgi:fructuronate reductase
MSPPPRLSTATLAGLRAGVRRFGYDRRRLQTGIVHLGLGAFARVHLAEYTEDVLERDFGAWGIVGVSLRSPDQRQRLAPQDGLFTALCREPVGTAARVIGCVTDCLVLPDAMAATLALMALPTTKIVSLTITEKGYCHDPATGRLNAAHPDIRHDLEYPDAPRSAVGLIVAAQARRQAQGGAPFTVLACDNLPRNGALVQRLVLDFAALRDDKLAAWIERTGAFPSTMVDRIVPATTEADIALAAELTGLHDAAPVAHEPFRQWVIEDRFVDGARPAWEHVGAELVADVAPFEAMKLRLLNGSHSALAYLGYLGGHQTIGDCVADPAYRRFVQELWVEEIIPVTPTPAGSDLHAYAAALLARYDNPAIRHRTAQIAMDGSQKLPQRLLGTIRNRLARGLPFPRLALAVAAWMIYVGGRDERGRTFEVRDPLAATFAAVLTKAGDLPKARCDALLTLDSVFGADLTANVDFKLTVEWAYRQIVSLGAWQAVESCCYVLQLEKEYRLSRKSGP